MCRRLVDAGAHVVAGDDRGRRALRRRDHVLGAGLRAGPDLAVRRATTPSRTPASARRADLVVVVPGHRPAARRLRRRASPTDLLTATLLATRAPVVVCPAMHTEMWEHPAVQENLATLRRRGVHVVEPEDGRLAGGDVGAGRLADAGGDRRRRRARCSAAQDLAGLRACWSPPAAPASPSTPCGSSPTARRASRATPSPPRPLRRAPRSRSSPPSTVPCPTGVEVRAGRDRGRDGGRPCSPGADAPTWSSWPPPWPTSARWSRADQQDQEGRRRARRSSSSRRPTSSPGSARPSARPGAGRLRRRDRRPAAPTPAGKLAAQAPRPDRGQRRVGAPASASSTTPTP